MLPLLLLLLLPLLPLQFSSPALVLVLVVVVGRGAERRALLPQHGVDHARAIIDGVAHLAGLHVDRHNCADHHDGANRAVAQPELSRIGRAAPQGGEDGADLQPQQAPEERIKSPQLWRRQAVVLVIVVVVVLADRLAEGDCTAVGAAGTGGSVGHGELATPWFPPRVLCHCMRPRPEQQQSDLATPSGSLWWPWPGTHRLADQCFLCCLPNKPC